ncbi:acriflavin resistance protein [Propionigenium maris DSM 9537]|uniref:Acriflavin resistance protein n=1 Tax=Propionigenium maris DSM 9537 TaxID=1123000 RepID=A0A9W6GJA9_9FUSO|nr:efflux RND transporter permease subunit [Propionigenium maris]GLI55243.1 acriflavin resistance protein [Propionigenium maris DSM 9537]
MRGIPALAIRKPATTLMLIVTMVVVGVLSLGEMPVELLPNFNIPVVTVTTTWRGAVPEDMDKLVTREIEDAVTEVEGVKDFYSFSNQGISQVVVEFDYGVDTDKKVDLIQTEVDKIRGDLPDDIDEPITDKIDVGGEAVVIIDFSGKDLQELRSIGENIIKPRFQKIRGVGEVVVRGGLEKEVLIEVDPYKLASHELDAGDVYNIVASSNINIPVGDVKSGEKKYLVKLEGELTTVEQVAGVVLKNDGGGILRLKDVARVSLSNKERDSFYRVNGEDAVSILVSRTDDGNAVEIVEKIRRDMEELRLYIPRGSELTVGYDTSKFINQSIGTVKNNAITGLFLASIILFLFLKSIKATGVIAMAIPASIIFTFAFMNLKGISINVISLMGLSLGVGMLVDNSVVVLDNIYRHYRELHKEQVEASREGASEIAIPIIASTATTVAVFIPIILREGLAKEIFSDMSYTITFSLLASLIVALTFVPMVASRFLAGENSVEKEGKVLSRVKSIYEQILIASLTHRWKTLVVSGILFVVALILGGYTGGQFMPDQDESQYTIVAELPPGMELNFADRISRSMEELTASEAERGETVRYSSSGSESRVAINVELVKKRERKRDVFEIVSGVRGLFKDIPDAKLNFITTFRGPESGEREFQFELYSTNYLQLEEVSRKLIEAMRGNEGLVDIKSSIEGGGPQAKVIINRDRAQYYGLRIADIARILSYQILGDNPITIKTDTQEVDVTVQLAKGFRRSLAKVMDSSIRLANGRSIKLSEVASLKVEEGTAQVERKNKIRKVTLGANFDKGYTQKDAQVYMEGTFREMEPPKTVTYGYGGEGQRLNDTMADLRFAMILSIFLVYFILVSQFESFILPFIIVGAIPLSIIGVFFGLFFTGMKFNVMVMVGIIMLVGIVVNNAIVLIDYIKLLETRGEGTVDAMIEAGKTRLRPIAMTTLTTVFGMIPLAISRGEGAEMYNSMAIAVIFGLSLSTLLTLVVIPVMYYIAEEPFKNTMGDFEKVREK